MATSRPKTSAYIDWRRANPDLKSIHQHWKLPATACLPYLVKPEGEAAFWPVDIVHLLAQLAELTSGDHATVKPELSQVCRNRLSKYPESDPDLIAQDVETVLRKRQFMKSKSAQKMAQREYAKAVPRLDDFPTPPPRLRKRKRVEHSSSDVKAAQESDPRRRQLEAQDTRSAGSERNDPAPAEQRRYTRGPVRFATPLPPPPPPAARRLPSPPAYFDSNQDLPPIPPSPSGLSAARRSMFIRQRERIEEADVSYFDALLKKRRKECDYQRTKYDILIQMENERYHRSHHAM